MPVEVRTLIEALRAEVATLKARLGLNSSDPSKPPSSGPPHVKPQPPRPTAKRKRGGRPGHKRAIRPMVPPDQLTGGVDCVPEVRPCGACRTGADPAPHPHQVAELPPIRPDVIEHRPVRPACERANRASLPSGVPAGALGPRLLAAIALLTGRCRPGKRPVQAALADLMGLPIPTGVISKAERRADTATTAPVAEVAEAIAASPALNVDEAGRRGARKRAWLWTAVGQGMTSFRIDRSRGAVALRRLVGEAIGPTITSDRLPAYRKAPRRQVCRAHLRRDFQAMIDRPGGRGAGGRGRVAGVLGPGVRRVARARRRRHPADGVAWHGGLAAVGGSAEPGGGARRPLPVDGRGVPSVAEE